MPKDKWLIIIRQNPRFCLMTLIVILVGLMLWLNNGVFIVLAAIFTFLYFGLWLKDNTRAFLNWIQRAKGDFAIFGEYADRFADMFLKNKEGKR